MTVSLCSGNETGEAVHKNGDLDSEAPIIQHILTGPRRNLTVNSKDINLAPENATERSLHQAAEALRDFREEPARPLSEERLPL